MKIIDLFAGAGGLSLGFKKAGFEIVLSNEIDEWASETYKRNHPSTIVITKDIQEIKDLKKFKKKYELSNIEGIIGGPPCQGFSLAGKRDNNDPRNSLFKEFIRFVIFFKPKFFVMENVKGLLSAKTKKGEKVYDIIIKEFNKAGYNVGTKILNSSHYGVPQERERLIFIGFKKDIEYKSDLIFPKQKINKFISTEEAISDLPLINAGEGEEKQKYTKSAKNKYQKIMRTRSNNVYNHVAMRHTERIIERFKQIKWGQSVKDVPFEHSAVKRNNPKIKSGKVFSQNNMRVNPKRPCPTIAASFQSNFIHPYLNRNFTAREGARLQSFPDNYIFSGKRTTMSWEKKLSQYQQIGNSVPPIMAEAIANSIKNYLNIK